jgi:hypothetical protein
LIFPDSSCSQAGLLDDLAPVAQTVPHGAGDEVRGVGRELHPFAGVEVFQRRKQADEPFLGQVLERLAGVEEAARHRLDQAAVVLDDLGLPLVHQGAAPRTAGVPQPRVLFQPQRDLPVAGARRNARAAADAGRGAAAAAAPRGGCIFFAWGGFARRLVSRRFRHRVASCAQWMTRQPSLAGAAAARRPAFL